jgi:predicted house-cleaning noncanonical NTP pyrophosphatase (MazG superfamily)
MTVYGKLVRDRIPEIISTNGEVPKVRVLEPQEVLPALIAKLHEEADELGLAEPADRLDELADVYEVLAALTTTLGFTENQVAEAATIKRNARGGFTHHLWLDEVNPAAS